MNIFGGSCSICGRPIYTCFFGILWYFKGYDMVCPYCHQYFLETSKQAYELDLYGRDKFIELSHEQRAQP